MTTTYRPLTAEPTTEQELLEELDSILTWFDDVLGNDDITRLAVGAALAAQQPLPAGITLAPATLARCHKLIASFEPAEAEAELEVGPYEIEYDDEAGLAGCYR